MNTRAREAFEELSRCQEEVEALKKKVGDGEKRAKDLEVKLTEAETDKLKSEPMWISIDEVRRLKESLHEQSMELVTLRVKETQAKDFIDQLSAM